MIRGPKIRTAQAGKPDAPQVTSQMKTCSPEVRPAPAGQAIPLRRVRPAPAMVAAALRDLARGLAVLVREVGLAVVAAPEGAGTDFANDTLAVFRDGSSGRPETRGAPARLSAYTGSWERNNIPITYLIDGAQFSNGRFDQASPRNRRGPVRTLSLWRLGS